MTKNTDLRMESLIKGMLLRENFNVFDALSNDQEATLIIRNITDDNTPQYIEVRILSRTVEYEINIHTPIKKSENVYYYYILHSPGMGRIWVLRDDELEQLRHEGMDARDSTPFLVKDFSRFKTPQLSIEEFKIINHQDK